MVFKRKVNNYTSFPTSEQIETAIYKTKYRQKYKKVLKSTLSSLIVVAAIAVLIATLMLPVLQIQGSSMEPTLNDEDIVVLLKTKEFKRGDLIGFYYQGKILLKRIVAMPEDEVVIEVKDFDVDNIGLYYTYYTEKIKYKHCVDCGKIIKIKGNKTKLCEECNEKRIAERNRNR